MFVHSHNGVFQSWVFKGTSMQLYVCDVQIYFIKLCSLLEQLVLRLFAPFADGLFEPYCKL